MDRKVFSKSRKGITRKFYLSGEHLFRNHRIQGNENNGEIVDLDVKSIEIYYWKLQMEHRMLIHHTETMDEFELLLLQITRSMAQKHFSSSMDSYTFYPGSVKKLSKENYFLGILQLINGLSEPIAKAILEKYPTLRDLYMEYRQLGQKEGELLLADLLVKRLGGKTTEKRIGNGLSTKVYRSLMCKDPDAVLN